MKYIARHYMLPPLIYILSMIGIIALTIITNNPIISLLIVIVTPIFFGIFIYKMKEKNQENKIEALNKRFHELKEKENPTMFEKLYVNAYNDKAIGILRNIINENKIGYIHNIDFDVIYNKEYVVFNFEYKKHIIVYYVYENKIVYYIDSPQKYDHLECNEEYEKPYEIKININEFDSLEDFFNSLIPNIEFNIKTVDEFEENVNIVSINHKTLDDIEDLKEFYKEMRIHSTIWTSIYCIMIGVLTYFMIQDTLNDFNLGWKIFGIILFIVMDGLGIFAILCCIYYYVFPVRLENDMKYQRVYTIYGKPYKVKIAIQSVGYKYSSMKFCSGINFYFKEGKRIKLIFPHYFNVPSRKQKQAIINELLKQKLDIIYYKKSKVIISGLESYRKSIIDKKRK